MPAAGIVHFDDYRLDVPNAQLWRGEQEVKLSPKALSVLQYLVERPGQLVSKDELFEAAWPEVVVSEGALTLVGEGLDFVHGGRPDVSEPILYMVEGGLLLAISVENVTETETCFRHALDIARRQGAKMAELGAVMGLSRLWQQQGKTAEAREMLSEIYGWFTEGFNTVHLQGAKALLDELS